MSVMKLRSAMRGCAVAAVGVLLLTAGSASAGEHPRLFCDAEAVPALRKRWQGEPYASMVKAMVEEFQRGEKDFAENIQGKPVKDRAWLYEKSARAAAVLYLATGKKEYADHAGLWAAKLVDLPTFADRGIKGLSRAFAIQSVTFCYDLCHNAWPDALRKKVSAGLKAGADSVMRSMGRGGNYFTASNWQTVRFSSAGLAYLACDEDGTEPGVKKCYQELRKNIAAALGENGWNYEGMGYYSYAWMFAGPYFIAAQRAGVGDIRKDLPKTQDAVWHHLMATVPIPRHHGMVGLHPALGDDGPGWHMQGMTGAGFWYAPQDKHAALKWSYDHLCGLEGDKSFDSHNSGTLFSLLHYPSKMESVNPAKVYGRTYLDKRYGVAVFRNRFQDANDIVVLASAHSYHPGGSVHTDADTNVFRVLGLGGAFVVGHGRGSGTEAMTGMFPARPPVKKRGYRRGGKAVLGELTDVNFGEDGSGTCVVAGSAVGVTDHVRRFGVDYSGASGAAAVIVSAETSGNGKHWRLNTCGANEVTVEGNGFTIQAPTGATLVGTVISPDRAKLLTGKADRGGGYGQYPYRGKEYAFNRWVGLDCDGEVLVVMTLQQGAAPSVTGKGTARRAQLRVGKLSAEVSEGGVRFDRRGE